MKAKKAQCTDAHEDFSDKPNAEMGVFWKALMIKLPMSIEKLDILMKKSISESDKTFLTEAIKRYILKNFYIEFKNSTSGKLITIW